MTHEQSQHLFQSHQTNLQTMRSLPVFKSYCAMTTPSEDWTVMKLESSGFNDDAGVKSFVNYNINEYSRICTHAIVCWAYDECELGSYLLDGDYDIDNIENVVNLSDEFCRDPIEFLIDMCKTDYRNIRECLLQMEKSWISRKSVVEPKYSSISKDLWAMGREGCEVLINRNSGAKAEEYVNMGNNMFNIY